MVNLLGVKIASLTVKRLKEKIISFATSQEQKTVLYANANSINLAQKNKTYLGILNSADILHSDGWGVVWASRFLETPLIEKIVVTDLFVDFCEELAKIKLRIYFLGSKPGIAEEAKIKLQQRIPSLNIVGTDQGYFNADADRAIVDKINSLRPDILLVGMGTPKQEEWIYYNRPRLNVPLCWSVGGLFDFVSGRSKRAPGWMRNYHLEWLNRLFQEPRRFWKRYLLGNPLFFIRVFKARIFKTPL